MFATKHLLASSLLALATISSSALSAEMTCHLNVKPGGVAYGNGSSSCHGIDVSFANTTSGKWEIKDITNSVSRINWIKGCSSGTSCATTVQAYSTNRAEAYIHYRDGSIEYVNASMYYETGR